MPHKNFADHKFPASIAIVRSFSSLSFHKFTLCTFTCERVFNYLWEYSYLIYDTAYTPLYWTITVRNHTKRYFLVPIFCSRALYRPYIFFTVITLYRALYFDVTWLTDLKPEPLVLVFQKLFSPKPPPHTHAHVHSTCLQSEAILKKSVSCPPGNLRNGHLVGREMILSSL